MAIKVAVDVASMEFDGVTLTLTCDVRGVGMTGAVRHQFTGLAANIANAAAMLPYIKGQVVTYMQSQFSITATETEICVSGAPL
jgi:hypothetical protein